MRKRLEPGYKAIPVSGRNPHGITHPYTNRIQTLSFHPFITETEEPDGANNLSEALGSILFVRGMAVRIESSHAVGWTVRVLFLEKTCTHQVRATKSCARGKRIDDDEAASLTMMCSSSAFDCARSMVLLDTRPMISVNTATSGTVLPSIARRAEQFRRFCGFDALSDRVGQDQPEVSSRSKFGRYVTWNTEWS
jgi:hypothetical protein